MKKVKGFTLVEIIIVVIVLAILASIAIPSYLNLIMQGALSAAKNKLIVLYNAEKNYFFTHGNYYISPNFSINDTTINQNLNVNVSDNYYAYNCIPNNPQENNTSFMCRTRPLSDTAPLWNTNDIWGISISTATHTPQLTSVCGNMLTLTGLQSIPGYGQNGNGGGCQTAGNSCPIVNGVQSQSVGPSFDCLICCGLAQN